jgi:hypothetical protein
MLRYLGLTADPFVSNMEERVQYEHDATVDEALRLQSLTKNARIILEIVDVFQNPVVMDMDISSEIDKQPEKVSDRPRGPTEEDAKKDELIARIIPLLTTSLLHALREDIDYHHENIWNVAPQHASNYPYYTALELLDNIEFAFVPLSPMRDNEYIEAEADRLAKYKSFEQLIGLKFPALHPDVSAQWDGLIHNPA